MNPPVVFGFFWGVVIVSALVAWQMPKGHFWRGIPMGMAVSFGTLMVVLSVIVGWRIYNGQPPFREF